MGHPIVHIELSAKDVAAAKAFYNQVFGWEMQDFPEMNYVTFSSGEGAPGGGFNQVSEQVPAGSTVLYINTEDIGASMAAIEAHGGKRTAPDIDIPGVGVIAWFTDPSGNLMSLLKPAEES